MADDEIRLDTSMDTELETALGRLEQRLSAVEGGLDDLRGAGRKAGEGVEAGMDKATRATDKTKRSTEKAIPPIKKAGDEISKTGRKAATASPGVDRFADKMDKAARSAGGLGSILAIYKWAGIATGVFALAGGVSALGAGAVIALGSMAPMVGVVAAIPTVFALAKLSMLALKLAATQLEEPLTRIKNQFTELGPVIAAGGLRGGLNNLANDLGGLSKVTGRGLAGLGGEMGLAATNVGKLVSSAPFLRQINSIFIMLRPVLGHILSALISIGRALLNVIQGSLPMVQDMARMFDDAADALQRWTARQLASGKMTTWLMNAWNKLRYAVGIAWDFLVGVFNIFRIGAGYSGQLGTSIHDTAQRFREWTESAGGQARINKYFADSLPTLREMGHLIAIVVGAFGHLAANQNVAPLLAQINAQLLPALGHLISSFSGPGGLGSAIISATAALLNLFAASDFSALTIFAQAIAAVANGILWLSQHVPGFSALLSTLLTGFLAFKLLGPVFSMVAGGAKAFSWLKNANAMTGELSVMQKLVGGVLLPSLRTVGSAFGRMAMAGIQAIGRLSVALVTTPVGWVILAIMALIAVIILLWTKCAWFRDAVRAVWRAIQIAALATWNAIKTAFLAVVNALVTAATSVRNFFVAIWQAIVSAVQAVWNALVAAWRATVDTIIMIARAIWDHGLKQTLGIIVGAFKIQFEIIRFVVGVVIYLIAALIAFLAWVAEKTWKAIAAGAQWLWTAVIKPVWDAIVAGWNAVTGALSAAWDWLVGVLTAAWNAFWAAVVAPVINAITWGWTTMTNAVSTAWNWLVGLLTTAWNGFWNSTVAPVINFIHSAWQALTDFAAIAWNGFVGRITSIWNGFTSTVNTVIGAIRTAWNGLTSWLSSVFEPVGTAIGKVWNGIQTVATTVADTVKGAWDKVTGIIKGIWNGIANVWNSIPEIHIPDWVPVIGGSTIGLPKLGTLYTGGPTNGPALVGEHGPEPLLRGGRIVDILGARGPEVRDLPRGGYVLPNLNTMARGMAKPIPPAVAASVARSAPAYASAGARHDSGLHAAVTDLASAVRERPSITASGPDVEAQVLSALRTHDREERAAGHRKGPYDYEAGRG